VLRQHVDRLRPVCPTCRASGRDAPLLALSTVVRCAGDDVLEGALVCPEPRCRREHPIIDGIAVVVADLVSWASHQLDAVLRRDDLSPFVESLLGDAAGPGSGWDRDRSALSASGRAHWGEGDPEEPLAHGEGFLPLLTAALDLLGEVPGGPWADLGCAGARGAVELARRGDAVVAGVDLDFSMLRMAERVRREGRAVFPLRRVGLVYDRRDLPVPDVPRERLSFWCSDVGLLPFADGTFAGALSLNVVDCVPSPLAHLAELGRILAPGAPVLLSSPYDWSVTATPPAQWLGGHSQRSEAHGSSAAELRRILSADAPAGLDTGLTIVAEQDRVRWRVPVNERACMEYAAHLLHLRRRP
jgi:SAM-dependent methyltransferase